MLVIEGSHASGEELASQLLSKNVAVIRTKIQSGQSMGNQIQSWIGEQQIDGVYFLASLDSEMPLDEFTSSNWEEFLHSRVYALYDIMRALPPETFLICATNTGGLHGYYQIEMHSTGGGVSGFCKALAQERPETLIKVIDFSPEDEPVHIAAQLIAETLQDPGVVEVGTEDGQRFGISLRECDWEPQARKKLSENTIYLVTGGTGGIVPSVIKDLYARKKGTYYLLGRSPLPENNDPNLEIFKQSGSEGLKQNWMQAMLNGGEKITPVQLQAKLDKFTRAAATLELIETINSNGGKARYMIGDITDPEDMDRIVATVLQEEGQIDVVIHAAGFEYSRKLEVKPWEEFKQSIEVKASSFFYLYKSLLGHHALPQDIVLFSSVAGRFGNSGQTDYSAANDLLSKMARLMNARHPQMRVVTIDWGPWAEVGMASRGNTPDLMEHAGIEMMSPQSAAPLVYQEITQGAEHEVVFAGDLGAIETQSSGQNSLDVNAANQALRAGDPAHVMLSSVTGYDSNTGMTFEVTLDPNQEPFLHDHSLNGTPLLPGVMGIEGFTVAAQHIASVLGSNDKTSLRVTELEDIQFLTPFKFFRNEPRHITWIAMPERTKEGLRVSIRLESINPSRLIQEQKPVLHFTGKVYLKPSHSASQTFVAAPPKWNGRYTLPEDEIYKLYFHGPAFQVLEGVQRDKDGLLGKLSTKLPPITSQPVWLDTNPILIELCLQTAGIYEIGKTGALSLPQSIHKVRFYRRETNGVPIYAQVEAVQTEEGLQFNSRVIDEKGRIYLELLEYRTATLPTQIEKLLLEPIERLLAEEA
ncbi:MAG: SDR family NAD(P)-dependent oxidoreductase [Gammaproteobacteria bacterium]|nr:SDR family NAD(P)-dependent oxidoreductase [Gammaproteobacteria bacterium]